MKNPVNTRYRKTQHKKIKIGIQGILFLFGLQLSNSLLLKLLNIPNTAWPWSFIEVLDQGFVIPVFLAFCIVFCPLIAFYFWWKGGISRVIAQTIVGIEFAFIVCSVVGFSVFLAWEGLTSAPYPWLIYTVAMQVSNDSVTYHHLILSLLGSYFLLLIGMLGKCFSKKTAAKKIFGHAHFSGAFEIQRAGLFADEGIILGKAYGRPLRLLGFESVLVVAPTGSGKTSAVAIPNLLEWEDSGVFNDLKGELYRLTAEYREKILGNRCYCWAPADHSKTFARYNPFFYVNTDPDLRIRDLQLIAETLIPANPYGERFWVQSSRELFLTLSLYLFETHRNVTLTHLHDLSKHEDFFGWLLNEIRENEAQFSKPLKQNAWALLGAEEKTQKNILKDFQSRLHWLNDPLIGYATSQNDVDFRELRRKKISIYIRIPDADKERLSPLLTLFWAQLIHVLSSNEPNADEPYGVLALLDEFGTMARMNKLKDGMSFLRSYHVRCLLIVQYLGQITATYGREDAKGFLNTKVKIAFALNDRDDAEFFSKALGSQTVKVSTRSISTGRGDQWGSRSENVSYQSRALLHPDELMQLPDSKAIILMEAKNPIKADKCYWFQSMRYRQCLKISAPDPIKNSENKVSG